MRLNGLENYYQTKDNKIIDFNQVDINNDSPLMYALKFNRYLSFNLNNRQFDYLIKNSNLNKVNKYGVNVLMLVLEHNKPENLNLTHEQFNYLIKNCDLKHIDKNGISPLIYFLTFKNELNIDFNKEQLRYLIDNSDLSLIKEKEDLIELKKIQSELLNDEILSKIDIKEVKEKVNKI